MSTWQRHRQRPFAAASSRSALGGTEVARPQLTWRDMQPILVRSAAVVGLAAAVAAALANDSFLPDPEPRPVHEAAVLIVQNETEGAGLVTPEGLPDSGEAAVPAQAIVEPVPQSAPAQAEETGAAAPVIEGAARPMQAEVGTAPESPPRAPVAAEETAAEPAIVGSLPPTECPRDWVSTEAAPYGGPCEQLAALVPETANAEAQRRLEQAAADRATETASLQFVPRIPKARPEPPAQPRKTARKAGWPADDPPNCGKKRARWRYVNDVPTWYCR